MIDFKSKKTGNSRFLKSSLSDGTTWTQALSLLRAGTFPVDFNGFNEAGIDTMGDLLCAATLLQNETAQMYSLDTSAKPNEVLAKIPIYLAMLEKNAQKKACEGLGTYGGLRKSFSESFTLGITDTSVSTKTVSVSVPLSSLPDGAIFCRLNDLTFKSTGGSGDSGDYTVSADLYLNGDKLIEINTYNSIFGLVDSFNSDFAYLTKNNFAAKFRVLLTNTDTLEIRFKTERPSGNITTYKSYSVTGSFSYLMDEPLPTLEALRDSLSVLNDCSWQLIRWASDAGIADLLWSVGDRKAVTLTEWGATGSYAVSAGTYYCYILGFNHNAAREGNNRIHFEFGFDAISGGNHIAFCGSDFGLAWGNTNPYYIRMNSSSKNTGGWKNSLMRTGTLNGSNRSFLSALPDDLKAVLKTVTKYTDNVGGGSGSVESNVTATTDTIFLLNVNEIRGTGTANTYEANYTKQYDYYRNGNPQTRAKSNDAATLCNFFTRSPSPSNAQFMGIGPSGGGAYLAANTVYSASPAFCV